MAAAAPDVAPLHRVLLGVQRRRRLAQVKLGLGRMEACRWRLALGRHCGSHGLRMPAAHCQIAVHTGRLLHGRRLNIPHQQVQQQKVPVTLVGGLQPRR